MEGLEGASASAPIDSDCAVSKIGVQFAPPLSERQTRIDAAKETDVFVAKAKVLRLVDRSMEVLREIGIRLITRQRLRRWYEWDMRKARRYRRLLAVRLLLIGVS